MKRTFFFMRPLFKTGATPAMPALLRLDEVLRWGRFSHSMAKSCMAHLTFSSRRCHTPVTHLPESAAIREAADALVHQRGRVASRLGMERLLARLENCPDQQRVSLLDGHAGGPAVANR